jgi:23S rRNA (cytidine1920-2'-O)/16S rRNA (cytidine1409-2'-O)-methyltransferase
VGKTRLDEALVARGFFEDRAQATRACLAGAVRSHGLALTKPGQHVDPSLELAVEAPRRYASRGGDKLAGALRDFSLCVDGLRCIDVGASSGGFTDCLLQQGAASVCAVDVGYGQFDWCLRTDERVTLFERTNIKDATPLALGAPFDLLVADVSFTPLTPLLPVFERLVETVLPLQPAPAHNTGILGAKRRESLAAQPPTSTDSRVHARHDLTLPAVLVLVKPQFELVKGRVPEGVVRDPQAHVDALNKVLAGLDGTGLTPQGLAFSAIKGPKGNIEFFLWAQWGGIPATIDVEMVVQKAHEALDREPA